MKKATRVSFITMNKNINPLQQGTTNPQYAGGFTLLIYRAFNVLSNEQLCKIYTYQPQKIVSSL